MNNSNLIKSDIMSLWIEVETIWIYNVNFVYGLIDKIEFYIANV